MSVKSEKIGGNSPVFVGQTRGASTYGRSSRICIDEVMLLVGPWSKKLILYLLENDVAIIWKIHRRKRVSISIVVDMSLIAKGQAHLEFSVHNTEEVPVSRSLIEDENKKVHHQIGLQSFKASKLTTCLQEGEISDCNHEAQTRTKSAIVIQTNIRRWKGYIERKHLGENVSDIRLRVQQVSTNVDDGKRIINRLIAELAELRNMKSASGILNTYATLGLLTKKVINLLKHVEGGVLDLNNAIQSLDVLLVCRDGAIGSPASFHALAALYEKDADLDFVPVHFDNGVPSVMDEIKKYDKGDASRQGRLGSKKSCREAVVLMIRSYLSKHLSIGSAESKTLLAEANTERVEGDAPKRKADELE
ncbi:hypothetical protein Tco_0697279 [Tanacetum coccineum]